MKRNWLGMSWGAAAAGLGLISMVGCSSSSSNKADALPPVTFDGGPDAFFEAPLSIGAGPSILNITEGSSGTVLVIMNRAPSAPITLTVTSSNPALAVASPATLTFSAANIGVPQTVVVTGVQDTDLASGIATVTLSGPGVKDAVIAVNVTDDDVQAFVVAPPSLTLTEGGAAGSASVHLAYAPAADLAVTVTSLDPARLGVAPAMLTFTAANYAMPQTVALTGKADVDNVTNNAGVAFKAEGVADAVVAVTIIDVDAQSLVIAPATLMIDEGDAAGGTFTVKLAKQPDREIKVNLSALNAQGITLTPAELTFTSANYNTAQSVKVVAAGDDNTVDENVEITATVAGLTPQKVNVLVKDKDTQAIVLSAATVALAEGGTGSFTVNLAFNPGATTTVTIASAKAAAASVSPTVLTFTSANFGTPQAVTVTGVQDDDIANESVVITASSTAVPSKTITATVTDNDTQAIVVAPATISVVETKTEALKVRLAFRPASAVTVSVVSANTAAATVAPATVTFQPADFATEQTVVVSGVKDANLAEETTKLTLSATGVASKEVLVTVVDNDVQNVFVSPSSLALAEAGPAKTFEASLAFAPQAGITATAVSNNPKVTVSPATFTLSGTAPQVLTVTPSTDDDAVDEIATITVSAGSLTNREVAVSVKDKDTQAHILSDLAISVTEEGAAKTFSVKLLARPVGATVVTVSSERPTAIVLSTTGAANTFKGSTTLTFTPDNYNVAQAVYAAGLADLNLEDEIVPVTASSAVAPSSSLLITNVENDLQDIEGAPADQVVMERTPSELKISLKFQPKESRGVSVTSKNVNIVAVNGGVSTNLLFTTSTWDVPQSVILTTPDDLDQVDRGSTTLTIAFVGASDNDPSSKVVNVTAKDPDRQAILTYPQVATLPQEFVNPLVVSVRETESAKFKVAMKFSPLAAAEIISVTSSNPTKISVTSAPTITFNAGNFQTLVEVTIAGLDDLDLVNETATITLHSDAAGTLDVTVAVNETDNDAQAILVKAFAQNEMQVPVGSVALREGMAAMGLPTFTDVYVSLQFDPGAAGITVAVTSADPGAVAVPATSLTFTSANYTMGQPVRISSVNDFDVRNENVVVSFASAGVQTSTVTATVGDDDTQSISVNTSALVLEGGTTNIPVVLTAQPTLPVSITATSSITAKATVSPATLTFDSTNWNVPQNFTLAGVQDSDLDDHKGSLTLAITSAQGQTAPEGAPNQVIAVDVGDDDSQTIIVEQVPALPFVLSVQEEGPSATFRLKLGRKPRVNAGGMNVDDVVTLQQSPLVRLGLSPASLTFNNTTWQDFQTVTVTGLADADAVDESVTVTLGITETEVRLPGLAIVAPTATQVVRVIDDEVAVVGRKSFDDLSGATEFTRRGNVSFGTTVFAFTGRNAQGASVVARESRELDGYVLPAGTSLGVSGVSPQSEVVEFDGGGFSAFSSDTSGIVFKRFSEDLATVSTPAATIAAGSVDDFWPSRTADGYSMVYRRTQSGERALFFRTVQLNGAVGSEEQLTVYTGDEPKRANLHYFPKDTMGNFPKFDGVDAPYLVIYSDSKNIRCMRLGVTGAKLVDQPFAGSAIVSSVQAKGDAQSIVMAYYDASRGLVAKRIRPGTSTMAGACVAADGVNDIVLRGPSAGTYLSMPTISHNGQQFAVSFDVSVSSEPRVGVALWDGISNSSTNMLIGLDATASVDQGSRPAVTWAGDRWVVRYKAETATGVKVRTGSFKPLVALPPT